MERTVSQGQTLGNDEGGGGASRKASPADRCRKAFKKAVSEGGLDFQGYCRLAAQAMLQLAIEEEAAEFIGRGVYHRLGGQRTTYRNGYKRRKVLTAEGAIRLAIPQTRNGTKRFNPPSADSSPFNAVARSWML